MVPCNSTNQQSIFVRLEDYWFEIQPKTYLINAFYPPPNSIINQTTNSQKQTQNLCTIGLLPHNESYILLGHTFMKNYYTIFDMELARVGLSNQHGNPLFFKGS